MNSIVRAACCLLLWFYLPPGAHAGDDEQLQQLIDQGQLIISSEVTPDNPVPGQEITLSIEISTDRWFAGGTQLKPGSSEQLMVIQRQALASNSSQLKQGKTWVVQLWELSLFAQRAGQLFSPEIEIGLSINTEGGTVEGSYTLPAISLQLQTPPELADIEQWVASSDLTASSQLDRSLDAIVVGDAFTLTVELRADDTLAMMLPEYPLPNIEGLGIYPQQPELINDSNRGNKIAIRRQTIDFVVEQPGHYQVPAVTVWWWNTQAQSLQQQVIPAIDFATPGAVARAAKGLDTGVANAEQSWGLTVAVMMLLMLAVIVVVVVIRNGRGRDGIVSAIKVQRLFHRAMTAGDAKTALRWAYYWLDHYTPEASQAGLRGTLEQLALADDSQQQLEALFENGFASAPQQASNFSLRRLEGRQQPVSSDGDHIDINPR